jgi:predicted AAA+ superfamily ATPase
LNLLYRNLEARIREALADTPVVMIAGPRQSGKTTLARSWSEHGWRYLTLDDELTLLAAREDATGLIRGLDRVVIDEVQRAPQLLLAIKKAVDEDRRPGRFLLTGSANLMALPTVSESLAGRMEVLSLLPFSQSEIVGERANWIDAAFAGHLLTPTHPLFGTALTECVLRGGYPEAVARETTRRRHAWARQYLDALILRDVKDVAAIDHAEKLPRFARAMSEMSGQICNYTALAAPLGLDHKTAARYVGVLEHLYLVRRLEAWSANRLKRVVKSPKLHFLDSGLLAALAQLSAEKVGGDRGLFGRLLETFVFSELMKHATTSETVCQFGYYRDHDQYEVDVLIENAAGEVVAVEVKAAASVSVRDLRGLKRLAAALGEKFRLGVVLYDGTDTLPLGGGMWAAPVASLWGRALGKAL